MKLRSIFLGILFLSSQGFSKENSVEERIEFIEEQHDIAKRKGQFQAIAEGNLLYWKANTDGTAYETTTVAVLPKVGVGTVPTNFKTRTPHFSYDPGFRLSFGFQSAYDVFDICLVWTRFYTKGKDKAHAELIPAIINPGQKTLSLGIGLIEPLTSIPNSASAECDIKENILDVQLGRGIDISHYFFLRPYFGVRGLWSDVHWDISINRTFLLPGVFDQNSTRMTVKNDFHAAGGLVGLNLDWKLPYGLGVCARGAAALVYGRTDEKTKQRFFYLGAFSTDTIKQDFHAHNSFHSVKGQMEIFSGIFWDSRMSKTNENKKKQPAYLRLFVGYEFQWWPWNAQKTIEQSRRERERFSLGFQGFTGGARAVF